MLHMFNAAIAIFIFLPDFSDQHPKPSCKFATFMVTMISDNYNFHNEINDSTEEVTMIPVQRIGLKNLSNIMDGQKHLTFLFWRKLAIMECMYLDITRQKNTGKMTRLL